MRPFPFLINLRTMVILFLLLFVVQAAAEQPWVEVRSRHFSLITDGGEKRGRAVLLRFEQMRAAFGVIFQRAQVNIPVPLQIVAFNRGKEMKQYTPMWKGKPVDLAGFFQGSSDRDFIALDLSSESGWGVVFHEYAHMLLNANIPPAPLWFDEGYAEYFSTLQVDDKNISLGLAPEHVVEELAHSTWMKSVDLFSVRHDSKEYNERDRRSIFYAQSWLTVHYFMNQRKGEQLSVYLELAGKHVPVTEAIQKAFGMDPAKLDRTLREYFQGGRLTYYRTPAPPGIEGGPYEVHPLNAVEAQAILADLHAHSLDQQNQGIEEFKRVLQRDPDNVTANRGLGYALMQQNNFDGAAEHLRRAATKDTGDARLHYFNALLMQRRSAFQGDRLEHVEEMRSELQKALAIDPNYADAYSLLALTDSARGDHQPALEHARKAVELNPGNEYLRSNLAMAQLRAEDWDAAAATLTQLKSSRNAQIAAAAERNLNQLNTMREQENKIAQLRRQRAAEIAAAAHDGVVQKTVSTPKAPPTLVVKYLKALLVSVDCTKAPVAVLNLESQGKNLKMRVADRGSVILIGVDKFSCEWKNRQVGVNYRPSADFDGEAITLELQ